METAEAYDKESHLAFLHGLVDDIKKEWPDENICVDQDTAEVVWGKKPSEQDNNTDTKHDGSAFGKYRRDYPWL